MRAKDYGLTFGFYPTGLANAITDVEGVMVGHCTLIRGEGTLVPGEGPVRTGVTVISFDGFRWGAFLDRPVAGRFARQRKNWQSCRRLCPAARRVSRLLPE